MDRMLIRKRAGNNLSQFLDMKLSLADRRISRGLSYEELADRMGVSESRVKEMEHYDSDLSMREMIKWLNSLEVKIFIELEKDGEDEQDY